ncbi:hypothetical protein [Compostimonas suwonensis]|nr:hypothetical protein [Compostimonas suwonensis]
MTVKWNGDAGPAAQFQPERDSSSVHFEDFKNLELTVSQTKDLGDQTVRVSVKNFAGTERASVLNETSDFGYNYLQAMQCWGNPNDPAFYETCQWGGWSVGAWPRTPAYSEMPGKAGGATLWRGGSFDLDVPFRSAQDNLFSSIPIGDGNPLQPMFDSNTSNEVSVARVGQDGSGWFDIETQSSAAAPQLDCGNPERADGTRCWLVVVPRGSHRDPDLRLADCVGSIVGGSYDRAGIDPRVQVGSPINPSCGFWDNRIVVPLDFSPVGTRCEAGEEERRVVGSPLLVGAMSSWQRVLCPTLGTTYTFSANPDGVAREQLVSGQAGLAFTSRPLTPEEFPGEDISEQLDSMRIVYAPLAVSGLTVGMQLIDGFGRRDTYSLTPRIMAKMLTQSYADLSPGEDLSHLSTVARSYISMLDDPDFALAGNPPSGVSTRAFRLVVSGPAGVDANRLLWQWIQADVDARAFLNGQADPWGMTVNPYYLPKGHPDAKVPDIDYEAAVVKTDPSGEVIYRPVGLAHEDGSPQSLATEAIDTFPKADESLRPLKVYPSVGGVANVNPTSRADSQQWSPYQDTPERVARQVFRADTGSATVWDPYKANPRGDSGDWVSGGRMLPTGRFIAGVTDTASADLFGLVLARLQVPRASESDPVVFVEPSDESLSHARDEAAPLSGTVVRQVDPASLSAEAYPLTVTTYAAVRLDGADPAILRDYAKFIEWATTAGQEPGSGPGQLPRGYLPLDAEQTAEAHEAVLELRAAADSEAARPPVADSPPLAGGSGGADGTSGNGAPLSMADSPLSLGPVSPNTPVVSVTPEATAQATASVTGAVALGGSLIAGVFGLAVAPLLLRRRSLGP